jgi:hypothetical protein
MEIITHDHKIHDTGPENSTLWKFGVNVYKTAYTK